MTTLTPNRTDLPPPFTPARPNAGHAATSGLDAFDFEIQAPASHDATVHDATVSRRRIAGVSVALAAGALVFVLRPLLTTTLVVSALGGVAALVALAALAAIVHLVVTDVWSDVRQRLERRAGRHLVRATDAGAPMTSFAPLGRYLAAYHATRRAR